MHMIFWIKPTSLFKLWASWWQLFSFFKTLTVFLPPFPWCLPYSGHSEWIFPCILLLACLSPVGQPVLWSQEAAVCCLSHSVASALLQLPIQSVLSTTCWCFTLPITPLSSLSVQYRHFPKSLVLKNVVCAYKTCTRMIGTWIETYWLFPYLMYHWQVLILYS